MSATHVLDPHTGCWVWQGAKSRGYGLKWRDGKSRLAHRVYYEQVHGPADTLDHLCRNKACVNPDHLEPCSRGENVRRGDVAKLDWGMVREIRELADTLEGSVRSKSRDLECLFPVSRWAIRNILAGQRWPESARPEGL